MVHVTEVTTVRDYLAQSVDMRRQLIGERPKGYAYDNLEDFVLRHGQEWQVGPRPKGVRQRTPKLCFANTHRLVTSAQGQRLGLRYVEGYAFGVIAIHHAWAVTPEGIVVDTTWGPDMGRDYFGVEFPVELVNEAIVLSGVYGVLDDWRNNYELMKEPYEPEDATRRLRAAWLAKR